MFLRRKSQRPVMKKVLFLSIFIRGSRKCHQMTIHTYYINFIFSHFIPLPKLSADGYRIIACSHPPSNVDLPKIDAVLSAWQIQLEVLMKSDLSKGFILISDIGTLNVALFTYLFSEFKKIVEVMKVNSMFI